MIRRREFIAGLGSTAAWPVMAWAQQPPMTVIGYLFTQSADDFRFLTVQFFLGLKEAGYVEGQNVAVEYRNAENQFDQLPALAADLVRRSVAVIFAPSAAAALAAKAATTTIPIVFFAGADPVASGLVASLNRPGGNVTGIANLGAELAPKRLQLLRQLLPKAARFGVLTDPAAPNAQYITDLEAAARMLSLQLSVVNARTDSDLETAFASFLQQRVEAVLVGRGTLFVRRTEQLVGAITAPVRDEVEIETAIVALGREPRSGLVVMPDAFTDVHRAAIILAAARNNVPTVYHLSTFVRDGGLVSYGPDRVDSFRRAATYVDRILRGEKPGDLPVQFPSPSKFEMVLNLKTAKTLGLAVPPSILLRATEVIE